MPSTAPDPIYRVRGIRAVEERFLAGAVPPLMERAGAAAAAFARRLMPPGAPCLIACGPGNNGGDGFVAARLLQAAGHPVAVAFAGDAARLPEDARAAYGAFAAAGGTTSPEFPDQDYALALDALFGIGLARPIEGRYADWIARFNALRCPRLAIDIPSGLDADTGARLGATIQATHTVTFIALKPGLLTLDGPDHCGEIRIAPLDLPAEQARAPDARVVDPALFAEQLRPRRRNSHKGQYGDAGIIGGAPGMIGAALLAGRAALNLGAGRVFVGMLAGDAPQVDPVQPELMMRPADSVVELASALAAGPGLGQSEAARRLLDRATTREVPLVLDADALNLVAAHPVLARRLPRRGAATLLTPHPAEAGRLLGSGTPAVQSDRIAAALELAGRFRSWVVLKGCGSVLAAPDGRWWINRSGNAGMASAGMGDVLTGLLVALLAQGWPAEAALAGAVHLHGAAADRLAGQSVGPVGLSASETISAAREAFNRWIASSPE